MRILLLVALLWPAAPIVAQSRQPETNVNSKYNVERVEVEGVNRLRVPKRLREDMDRLVGRKFDQKEVDELVRQLQREFPRRDVRYRVKRGEQPDTVRIVFDLGRYDQDHFDLAAPLGLYHSKEGWSGELDGIARASSSTFTFGVLSNNDRELSRFAGIKAGYENRKLGTDWARLRFLFESYHEQWGRPTLEALGPASPDLFRTRQNFAPALVIVPARHVDLSFGVSFNRMQYQYPVARTQAANAATFSLRFDRQAEDTGANRHSVTAGYDLRAATNLFDSDFIYTRHYWDGRYHFRHRRHALTLRPSAGLITGRSPLFERFVLGNAETLRGWTKWDVAPLGATRMVHNSIEYRYKSFRAFYDVGGAWLAPERAKARHAAGAGLQFGDFSFLVGFPIRSGRAEPVFIVGLNL